MPLSIRLLEETDLENADPALETAFRDGSSRMAQLRMYRKLQPDGWLLALQDERPVGIVGAINYCRFAYAGMMAVHQEYRRQGIGRALMERLLAWLDAQDVPLVLLDTSDKGQPLYEKLGFRSHDHTYVMERRRDFHFNRVSQPAQSVHARDLEALVQYDVDIFGADRGRVFRALLDAFPGRAFLVRDEKERVAGYLFDRGSGIGPWVAERQEDAAVLLQTALSLPREGTPSLVVPEASRDAIDLLTRYGFEITRTHRHMSRGKGVHPIYRGKIYAQANLTLG